MAFLGAPPPACPSLLGQTGWAYGTTLWPEGVLSDQIVDSILPPGQGPGTLGITVPSRHMFLTSSPWLSQLLQGYDLTPYPEEGHLFQMS